MRIRGMEDFYRVDEYGNFIEPAYGELTFDPATLSKRKGLIASATPDQQTGTLDSDELGDVIGYDLTAGTTYTFAYRPTAVDGIEDPLLAIFNSHGVVQAQDDDGGYGRSSLITFTPTKTGTYYLFATSWVTQFTSEVDTGGYTIDMWIQGDADDVPGTTAEAEFIDMSSDGTVFSNLETVGDVDVYEVSLTAGQYYEWVYNGGVDGSTVGAGESVPTLRLLDADGNLVSQAVTVAETGLGFVAQTSGTYYLEVKGFSPAFTGGYTLDHRTLNLADYDPLESLYWDTADNIPFTDVGGVPTVYVYFAPAGVDFVETNDQGGPMLTLGWNQTEINAVMLALDQYEQILGVNYVITQDPEQATFRFLTTNSDLYGAYAYPQDEDVYGDAMGTIVFNRESGGWGDFPQSLEQGGFSFAVILHELGHAHGLAHPHDTGGDSEIMLGVFASQNSYGVYNLNQGVYTVMSYNDAWDFHPDGPSSFTIAGIDNGWSGTLSAFDIAALQARYDVLNPHNIDNTTYTLTHVVNDAYYQTIWDTGGTDVIAYSGHLNAQIDLTAATLDYSPTGGGALSFLYNTPGLLNSAEVKGGFTIANGVVIENATGGSGNDTLLGNSTDNVLTGNDGNDVLMGRGGDDTLNGGNGSDTASYAEASGGVIVDLVAQEASGADGDDILSSVENAVGSNFADTIDGDNGDNVIEGLGGVDTLNGGLGIDTLSYRRATGPVQVNLLTGIVTGAAGADIISGFENIVGSAFADSLTGDDGDNVIEGGRGNDTLIGGLGTDTASYANASAAVTVDLAAGTATGGDGADTLSGLENVIGSSFADTITGTSGDNVISGGAGSDTVSYANAGGGVNVNLAAGTATGFGNDTLNSLENVIGSEHNDVIVGSGAANIINAGGGADNVRGGDRVDVITLGAGNDTFVAEVTPTKTTLTAGAMSLDIVKDFDQAGNDLIDVSELGDFTFVGTADANDAGEVGYKSYGNIGAAEAALGIDIDGVAGVGAVAGPVTIVYGNVDGGGADFAIILLGENNVQANDFILT